MRILIGMPQQGSHGGPGTCEPPFIAELRRLGHQVDQEIYSFSNTGAGLSQRVGRVLNTRRRLQQRVSGESFDVIHINTSFDTKALLRDAAILPKLNSARVPIFLKFHGGDAALLKTTNPALALARQTVLSNAQGVGLLSSEEYRNFIDAGIPAEKLFVIKNVVEPLSSTRDEHFRQAMNLPADVPLLLFIGRFIPAKGLTDVIEACGLLRRLQQPFFLLCVGDGPARAEAERQVDRLRLTEHVRFFGYIPEDQTKRFYANCDVLVFPTYHYEGFPMVIFNAAAAGLPIVTTRIRAAADYLTGRENCLWVQARNPADLAEKLTELLSSKPLATMMGTNNRELAGRFNAGSVTSEYVTAYETLLSSQ